MSAFVFSVFLLLSNSAYSDSPFQSAGQAHSATIPYSVLDELAQGRADKKAEAQCPDGAIRVTTWTMKRWKNWDESAPCSPYQDECPVEEQRNSNASAWFQCRR